MQNMTVAQLKQLAKEKNVAINSKMKKAEIISAIEASEPKKAKREKRFKDEY